MKLITWHDWNWSMRGFVFVHADFTHFPGYNEWPPMYMMHLALFGLHVEVTYTKSDY